MSQVAAWGAPRPGAPLEPLFIARRSPGPGDVAVDILFCGVCHSDIHQVRDEWGAGQYPMVPGHEIVGRVRSVGADVRGFAAGDLVGVGCMVDSCRTCAPCRRDLQQHCHSGPVWTYGSALPGGSGATQGGYSAAIVVDQAFVLRIPAGLDPAAAAPLLCAGITTYSPLRQFGCRPGHRVGVVGLGGLGHMAVKLARSLGATVTVLSTSPGKQVDANQLGAHAFVCTRDPGVFERHAGSLDLIIDTVSAPHDYNAYLGLLDVHGAMALVGVPPQPSPLHAFALIHGGKRIFGSLIGGIAETQEMLDHCAQHGIVADIERIDIQGINQAYERVLASDVRYRFVIDMGSLG